jgi:cell wall assembly regulator SMI1
LLTNPELWLHQHHWEAEEVTIAAAGAGGQQNLGAAVGAGLTRRIRELTIRHAGTNNTVVTLLIAGGATKVTIDVSAQSTRVWSSQDGREFAAGEQSAVQSSDVTGGNTFVSAAGVED